MVELSSRLEGIEPVAIGTGRRKRFLMIILMTGNAFGADAEVSTFLSPYFFIGNVIRFVAISTQLFGMGPG